MSPGTSYTDQSRSIEFNHIFKRNIQLLTKERPKEQSLKFDNYEIIFGGDMNTHNFNKIAWERTRRKIKENKDHELENGGSLEIAFRNIR